MDLKTPEVQDAFKDATLKFKRQLAIYFNVKNKIEFILSKYVYINNLFAILFTL